MDCLHCRGVSAHEHYLDALVNNLKEIKEDKHRMRWIMREGIWFRDNSATQNELCDLILVYQDNTAVPVELKGSYTKKYKALSQIRSGQLFIENMLGYRANYGKFVWYTNGVYGYEKIEL